MKSKSYPGFRPPLALIALTLLAYANSFHGGFVLDNRGLILNDTRIREATAANLSLIFGHTYWWPNGESGLYRPFTTLTYLFNYSLLGNGAESFSYHIVNFLLHTGNVLLAYALARRLLRSTWPAFFTAALWAAHPVLTESVTNMVGRADLLAAAALLGSVLLYLKSTEVTGARRVAWLGGLFIASALGALSKESAAAIPAAILLCELLFGGGRKWGRAQLMGLAAASIPIALMLWQRAIVMAGTLPMEIPFTDNPIVGAGFLVGRRTALNVIARGFGLILWPATLSADYSWSQIPLAQGGLQTAMACGVALAIVALAWFLYGRNRTGLFFFALGLASLLPSANLLFPIGTIMAERFLYLPALGLAACVVPAIYALIGNPRYCAALLAVTIAALTGRTWLRNADWNDDLSMATSLVRTSPESFKAHDLMANVLYVSDSSHANLDRVIAESERSLAILAALPDSRKPPDPYRFAAGCYMERKDYAKAVGALQTFLVIESSAAQPLREADAYRLLAAAYLSTGDSKRAGDALDRARALEPMNPQLYRLIADLALSAGRLDDAAVALVEGSFVTSDKSLRQALVELYRNAMDSRSCALTQGPNGAAINPACPVVHKHVCAAAVGTVRALTLAGKGEVALARRAMFVKQFGCPDSF
jgi:tetratricopeptide (TPR) repeat protein